MIVDGRFGCELRLERLSQVMEVGSRILEKAKDDRKSMKQFNYETIYLKKCNFTEVFNHLYR
jgi:hypothetical protein